MTPPSFESQLSINLDSSNNSNDIGLPLTHYASSATNNSTRLTLSETREVLAQTSPGLHHDAAVGCSTGSFSTIGTSTQPALNLHDQSCSPLTSPAYTNMLSEQYNVHFAPPVDAMHPTKDNTTHQELSLSTIQGTWVPTIQESRPLSPPSPAACNFTELSFGSSILIPGHGLTPVISDPPLAQIVAPPDALLGSSEQFPGMKISTGKSPLKATLHATSQTY